MTVCKTIDTDRVLDFKVACAFLIDTVVDAPEWADAEDCVGFTLDMMADEAISDESYDALYSVEGRAALYAFAKFVISK